MLLCQADRVRVSKAKSNNTFQAGRIGAEVGHCRQGSLSIMIMPLRRFKTRWRMANSHDDMDK